jgi:hypothetical protein
VSLGAVVLGVVFPVFGVSLLVVLAVEAVIVKRRQKRGAADTAGDVEEARAVRESAR